MYVGTWAKSAPERAAVIVVAADGSEHVTTYRELDERSARLARWLRAAGLGSGDVVAVLADNRAELLEVAWAAQRSGLYVTAVNRHLTAAEVDYIVADSGARALVTTPELAELATGSSWSLVRLVTGDSYEKALAEAPDEPLEEVEGDILLYSSGTTGHPKGIKRPLTGAPMGEAPIGVAGWLTALGMVEGDVYLCPAPLYHAAPLGWSMSTHRLGGTVVVLERFDAEQALAQLERHRVTHSQWVPTMFVRMLKLPPEVRARYDLSAHRVAVHAAAPCPVEVKRAMIDWWGPILTEYYASTEGIGATMIDSAAWLAHPGSVGRPIVGQVHILGPDGSELPVGEDGQVWFSGSLGFSYHNDQEKTAAAHDGKGRATVGDIGHVDDEGYLYLTDRANFMIISGGVNVYPREAEDALITHPAVLDVAVIGVPHPDLGEVPHAVVQLAQGQAGSPELTTELLAYCRARLASIKCPRTVEYVAELPRTPTGKLVKRLLRR
ncbi:MAG TPA: acyl-CoA synthetase [Amycolatopsis sp.]|nr:acyl-CoA synthetase [Amycolatopsis sp.]